MNPVKIEFLNKSQNESFARAAVAAYLIPFDPNMEELSDIKTAVSEAVTNAIVHGYPKQAGTIVMTMDTIEEHTIRVTVQDQGIGIPDVKAAREPLFTTGGEERSGMGFTIMERFMTEVSVESELNRGTTVVMIKTLSGGNLN